MKPEYLLVNWSAGAVYGSGTEAECREQLKKYLAGTTAPNDSYIIAEVKVLSELRRVES